MRDIGPGCEAAMQQFERWINSMTTRDFNVLNEVLADDVEFSTDSRLGGQRLRKAEILALNGKMRGTVKLVNLVARKMSENTVTSLILTEVKEEFEELGPDMPNAEAMNALLGDARVAYAAAWRRSPEGKWQCYNYIMFGPVV